jgi:hypothetical protein
MWILNALQPACRSALAPERDLDRCSSSDYRFALEGEDDDSSGARAAESQGPSRPHSQNTIMAGSSECMTQLVEMNLSEYEAVRAGPGRWVVVSAHIDVLADSILARRKQVRPDSP